MIIDTQLLTLLITIITLTERNHFNNTIININKKNEGAVFQLNNTTRHIDVDIYIIYVYILILDITDDHKIKTVCVAHLYNAKFLIKRIIHYVI